MIAQLLNSLGLPWRKPRAQVEAEVGVATDAFYARPALFFPDAVQPPGFLQPWRADVFERYAPDLPIVRFTGLAWFADDARLNIQRIADHFAAQLGPLSIREEWNTLRGRWQAGPASLELRAWLPTQPAWHNVNPAQDREPRLKTASYVELLTGFRLPLSEEEAGWVSAVQPIARARPASARPHQEIHDVAPGETEVEYAREPTVRVSAIVDQVGVAPGCAALILCTHQLFVVRAGEVLGFEVVRMWPAKGAGGSTLLVRCRTSCPGIAFKTLDVAEHPDPDGLTRLGQTLSGMFGTECYVRPYVEAS